MAPRQWTCLARTAQFEATPRESDPRSTADARRAPVRIRYARIRNPGQQKTRHAVRRGFWKLPDFAFSRGKRGLRPPSSSSGRRSVLCCVLSCCSYSLASAGNVCWAKPNHGFFSCQQPGATFFRRARRRRAAASPRRGVTKQACTTRAQRIARNACAKTPVFFAVLCLRSCVRMRGDERCDGSVAMPLMAARGHRNGFASRCSRRVPWRVAQADLRKSARTPLASRVPLRGADRMFEGDCDASPATRSRVANQPIVAHGIEVPSGGASTNRCACPTFRPAKTKPAARGGRSSVLVAASRRQRLLSPALPAIRRSRPGRAAR